MKKIIAYLYYHCFCLVKVLTRRSVRTSTVLYLSLILFFVLFPFVTMISFLLLGRSVLAIGIPVLILGYLCKLLINGIVNKKPFIVYAHRAFRNETKYQRVFGMTLLSFLIAGSPILGIFILINL